MKTKLTLALAAALTGTAFAAFQAPLPEFKNEKQLAEWRAEMAAKPTSQKYAAEPSAFYTGKPYVASSGAYAFKYRSYNPDLARWTSGDPSGFPDGSNNQIFVNNMPTLALDAMGKNVLLITNINAVAGFGHGALLVGSDNSWTLSSYGTGSSSGGALTTKSYTTWKSANNDAITQGYTNFNEWYTDRDADALQGMVDHSGEGYNIDTHNCQDVANFGLAAAGLDYEEINRPNRAMAMDYIKSDAHGKLKWIE